MKNVLLESDIDPNLIDKIEYLEENNQIIISSEGMIYKYNIEEVMGTYILTYEQPEYVRYLGKKVEDENEDKK